MKLKFGAKVKFTKKFSHASYECEDEYHPRDKDYVKKKKPYRVLHLMDTNEDGYICGFTFRAEGILEYYYEYDDFITGYPVPSTTHNYLSPTKYIKFYKVATSMRKIELVREEDIELISEDNAVNLKTQSSYKWSNEEKENLRQEMKDWPRDSKGRWLPYSKF